MALCKLQDLEKIYENSLAYIKHMINILEDSISVYLGRNTKISILTACVPVSCCLWK